MPPTCTLLLLSALSLTLPPAITSATYAGQPRTKPHSPSIQTQTPASPAHQNPLLPPAVPVSAFFPDIALVQRIPAIAPAGFAPLYSSEDWTTYRTRFGNEADSLTGKRASIIAEFSTKLTQAAESEKTAHPGLARLLLLRAAAVCHRNAGGYEPANKAVAAYQKIMDIRCPTQVGALWTITNAMSRLAVTPKPERIRYSGIAARANTQLAILLLESDQVDAADSVIKLVGYHEGWLKSDHYLRSIIAQTRTVVRQTTTMMDYLGTQYTPAIRGDDSALMALFIYGRFVKNNPTLVADFPSRKPNSPMAQLAASLAAGEHDPAANYAAAESLHNVAAAMPEGVLKQRTLYASLERYRAFYNAPETAKDRFKRELAFIAIEAARADGARPGITIHPFEDPKPATATAPTPTHSHVAPTHPPTPPAAIPSTQPSAPSMPLPPEPDGPIVG